VLPERRNPVAFIGRVAGHSQQVEQAVSLPGQAIREAVFILDWIEQRGPADSISE
jgi:hypothetical protein